MWVEGVTLFNIRSFERGSVGLSRGLNVFIGANNSGKSTFLLPLLSLQSGLTGLSPSDVRIRAEGESWAVVEFSEPCDRLLSGPEGLREVTFRLDGRHVHMLPKGQEIPGARRGAVLKECPGTEPDNFLYPYLSGRKATRFAQEIGGDKVKAVTPTLQNLYAKIDRLSSSEFLPAHEYYMQACDEILGHRIAATTAPSGNGKVAVYTVRNEETIPITTMGSGTVSVLGLIVDLAIAENKLFLIEEPEDDIHPHALKALLDLIIERSQHNQFVITTHSNIVLRTLGAAPEAKVFRFDLTLQDRLPTSTVQEVPAEPEHRRAVLQELGYELSDFDLWDGWLILEEASAEKVIRKYLMPWFVRSLQGRLATFSARSLSGVKRKFDAFTNLFVFLHLQPVYKNRAWVVVDGGEAETGVIDELKDLYGKSGWEASHFRQLSQHDFEHYYPDRFEAERNRVLSEEDKQKRRHGKKELLDKVETWATENPEDAKAEFERSAEEVIAILREIEAQLSP